VNERLLILLKDNIFLFPEQMGDAAMTAKLENEEALQDAILHVLTDSELRTNLARRSLERSQLFSWIVAARKMVAILEKVSRQPV